MTKSFHGLLYPAAVLALLSCFYREARVRFAQLLRPEGFAVFLLVALPWHIWMEWQHPGFLRDFTGQEWFAHLFGAADYGHTYDDVSRSTFAALISLGGFPGRW